jgi:hypothetical protein
MSEPVNVQAIVQQAIDEYMRKDVARREPAYKTELHEERRRREQLEKRVNELVEENKRSRAVADEAQRSSHIRTELQKLGVTKIDLAYKAVQDGIVRSEDGRLVARGENGEQPVGEYLAGFVQDNPEFLPARIAGGTGMTGTQKASPPSPPAGIDVGRISPSMSKEELDRVRQEILRVVTTQTPRGV